MSLISFNEIADSNTNSSQISFFSIKDGEEAIVRIMLDSVDEFPLFQVHQVEVNGKRRSVNCLRKLSEPADKCPLCAAGAPVKQSFYIPMLHYTTNADGSISVSPVIWTDRSMTMARNIKGYLDNYGPLSNIICKITRKGSGLNTEWSILPNLNPQIYRPDIYVKKTDMFDNYQILGTLIINRDFNDLQTFVNTGSFPANSTNNSEAVMTENHSPVINDPVPEIPNTQKMPWENTPSSGITRPVRSF